MSGKPPLFGASTVPKIGDDLRCPDHPSEPPHFDEDGPFCPACGEALNNLKRT